MKPFSKPDGHLSVIHALGGVAEASAEKWADGPVGEGTREGPGGGQGLCYRYDGMRGGQTQVRYEVAPGAEEAFCVLLLAGDNSEAQRPGWQLAHLIDTSASSCR